MAGKLSYQMLRPEEPMYKIELTEDEVILIIRERRRQVQELQDKILESENKKGNGE